jgi:putative NADH-flavin reductase
VKIVIFGPTGGTGRLLVDKAVAAGHSVTAFARNIGGIAPRPNLTLRAGSVMDPASVEDVVAGHEAVLSALGGRPWRRAPICGPAIRNIAAAMGKHGLRRIVVISTHGAAETRADVDWMTRNVVFGLVLRNEVADKEAMERFLAASDLDWTVVRVGVLTNAAAQGIYRASDDRTIREMGKIARSDVADFMLAQLADGRWMRRKPSVMY